jgi:hypothetical protein
MPVDALHASIRRESPTGKLMDSPFRASPR